MPSNSCRSRARRPSWCTTRRPSTSPSSRSAPSALKRRPAVRQYPRPQGSALPCRPGEWPALRVRLPVPAPRPGLLTTGRRPLAWPAAVFVEELQHRLDEVVRVFPDGHVPALLEDAQPRVGDRPLRGDGVAHRNDRVLAPPDEQRGLAQLAEAGRKVDPLATQ